MGNAQRHLKILRIKLLLARGIKYATISQYLFWFIFIGIMICIFLFMVGLFSSLSAPSNTHEIFGNILIFLLFMLIVPLILGIYSLCLLKFVKRNKFITCNDLNNNIAMAHSKTYIPIYCSAALLLIFSMPMIHSIITLVFRMIQNLQTSIKFFVLILFSASVLILIPLIKKHKTKRQTGL